MVAWRGAPALPRREGRDAGEAMVASGWAKPYVYGGVEFERVETYRAAEALATSRGAGVHAAVNRAPLTSAGHRTWPPPTTRKPQASGSARAARQA